MQVSKTILTGHRDADLAIMNTMDDKSLFRFCMVDPKNEYLKNLCNNESFWRNKFLKKFGEQILSFKNPAKTIKKFYLELSYYDDKYLAQEIQVPEHLKNLHNLPPMIGGIAITPEMLENVRRTFIRSKFDDALKEAARGGMKNVDVINYLIFKGATNLNPGMIQAAEKGNKKLVEFFIRKGANDMNKGLTAALKSGNSDLIAFFKAKGGQDTSFMEGLIKRENNNSMGGAFY